MNLDTIRQHLTWGDRVEIAKTLKVTKQYVNAVLRGKRYSIAVLEEAVKIAQKNKERKEELNAKIQSL
ncbi:MAG TPA: hypothetical protein VMW01_16515 [Williamwhitmania sp.]|nr:hypothetical protein [Williamwhitmania sp.]